MAKWVYERITVVITAMGNRMGRWKKSKSGTGGKVGDGGATGNKIKKTINRKDDKGIRLRCRECNSYRHMREECKDKGK